MLNKGELKRTNVNIEKSQYNYLKAVANRKSTSLSAILREAITVYRKHSKAMRKDDPIFKLAGIGKAGKHAARDHDKLLYRK